MDAVVLIGGCDKTVPAQLMAAASADIPAVQLITGSMLTGSHAGTRVGACTDCRRYWAKFRAGEIDQQEIDAVNDQLVASVGTCSVMGTASTMACVTEALGLSVAGGASPPAVSADRIRAAESSGAAAVASIARQLTPTKILTPQAFENALRVLLAIGGSTNALIHLTALAGRLGIKIDLQRLDRFARETPVLVDLKPSGQHYMEDFHHAGGMPRLLRELKPLLHLDCLTISGDTLGEQIDRSPAPFAQSVIRPLSDPIYEQGGLAVLFGNLAPLGAIIKQSAASRALMQHEGRAVVFENLQDMAARIDADDLDVQANDILVLKNIGPKGAPGMPEAGALPIPRKLARQGITDMVRISDGRMSGTAAGTVILHVSPESAVGGPLGLVQTGDRIRIDVAGRAISLLVDEKELNRRRDAQPLTPPTAERGYRKLFLDAVLGADEGADFHFLRPPSNVTIPR
jgi:dihydroxy-acid dehydratase